MVCLPGSPRRAQRRSASHRIHASRVLPHLAEDLNLFSARRRVLRIAVYADFYPVAYRDAKREYQGLDVAIMRAFCRATGLRPVFVPVRDFVDAWEQAGRWLNQIDVAVGGVGRSPWRSSDTVEWTVPYFRLRRTVVYNLKNPIRRFPEDVTGKIVGTMGSIGMVDASRRMARVGKEDLLDWREASDKKDLKDLLAGKVQGIMRGSFVGEAIVAKYPDRLGMVEPWDADPRLVGAGGEVFAFPCRRGSGLAGQLNVFLMHLSATGQLREMIRRFDMA